MSDPFDLERFVVAQARSYGRALDELRAGAKRSHWMWFVFPQIAGLGRSRTAQRYAIESVDEARAYLDHSLLGGRLRECTRAVLQIEGKTAQAIFGYPDWLKLRSCLTLFDAAAPGDVFGEALDRYFDGDRDALTLTRLGSACSE